MGWRCQAKGAMTRVSCVAMLAAGIVLGGCQSEPMRRMQADLQSVFGSTKGVPSLATGVRQYEEGNYAEATKSLHNALHQGLSGADQVKAYKYLAFINCVSDRPSYCREEFRRALAIDPSLELTTAEAGHPIWGPVFRAVKAGR